MQAQILMERLPYPTANQVSKVQYRVYQVTQADGIA